VAALSIFFFWEVAFFFAAVVFCDIMGAIVVEW